MHRTVVALLLGVILSMVLSDGVAVAAEAADETVATACKTAEVNPVTGFVFCIDPLGAPVEAPPEGMKPTCETQSRSQWTWAPNCEPAIEGTEG